MATRRLSFSGKDLLQKLSQMEDTFKVTVHLHEATRKGLNGWTEVTITGEPDELVNALHWALGKDMNYIVLP